MLDIADLLQPASPEEAAAGSKPQHFYHSKRFIHSQKYAEHVERVGKPARFAWAVHDSSETIVASGTDVDGYRVTLRETPATRQQVKQFFFEDDRHLCHLQSQRLSADGRSLTNCFIFERR